MHRPQWFVCDNTNLFSSTRFQEEDCAGVDREERIDSSSDQVKLNDLPLPTLLEICKFLRADCKSLNNFRKVCFFSEQLWKLKKKSFLTNWVIWYKIRKFLQSVYMFCYVEKNIRERKKKFNFIRRAVQQLMPWMFSLRRKIICRKFRTFGLPSR